MTTFTGDDTTGLFLNSYVAPAPGEFVTGASVLVMGQGLANDIANLEARAFPFAQVTRQFTSGPFWISHPDDWDYGLSVAGSWSDLQSPPNQNPLEFPLDVPDHAILLALVPTIKPAGGHGALPADMPKIELFEVTVSTGVEASLGSQVDTSANVTAYQLLHTFPTALTITGSNTAWVGSTAYSVGDYRTRGGYLYFCTHAGTSAASPGPTTTDRSILDGTAVWTYAGADNGYVVDRRLKRYSVRFSSEGGANAAILLRLISIRATWIDILPGGPGR